MVLVPSHVVIHTAGTPGKAVDVSAAGIDAYHRSLGWRGIGYQFVVRFDGTVETGRSEREVGAHVEGFNHRSLGICFSGNGDLQDFTDAQKAAGARLVLELLRRHRLEDAFMRNPMRVLGHRECNALVPAIYPGPKTTKSCPGRMVDCRAFRQRVMAELVGT